MAFTYTDKNQKRTVRTGKAYKATVNAAVEVGDLLAPANADASSTYKLADDSDRAKAVAVALESSVAAAEEISVADWAELQTQDTIGAAGAVTEVFFAASTDFLGAPLFLGESGKPSSDQGTSGQQIGILTARNRILVNPAAYRAEGTDLTNAIADPGDTGAIPVDQGSGSVALVTAGAETRTLADPEFIGQQLSLYLKTDGGDCVVTSASDVTNTAGQNIMTFADVGDHVALIAIEDGADLEWRQLQNDGAALT